MEDILTRSIIQYILIAGPAFMARAENNRWHTFMYTYNKKYS